MFTTLFKNYITLYINALYFFLTKKLNVIFVYFIKIGESIYSQDMIMKKTLHILTVLLFPVTIFCQDEFLSRLTISGTVSELGISPSEEIWVATKAGNVYCTKKFGELWHNKSIDTSDPKDLNFGKTFERLNFFSEDTLMISGFIQEDDKQDFVYWSGNHGKTWEKVIFGKSSWLDAAFFNNNGKGWMSGNSQLIYYTKDKGKSWITFDKVEQTGNLRFSTIHFSKDEKIGLFGSFWNVLYKTEDNCQSWEKLSTPLGQNKYERLSKEDRPDIRKIRIFGDYYIINQQGRIFITKSKTIDWVYLPTIIDFEVSENETLYAINSNLNIELYNSDFNKIWHSEQNLESKPSAIGVKNNNFYALTNENLYKVSTKELKFSQLFTNDFDISEPYLKQRFEDEDFGFENRDILRFDAKKKLWYRYMILDFSITNATIFNNNLIVSDNFNRHFKLDYKTKTISAFELPSNLFSAMTVKEVHFEYGSQGCFHSNNSIKSYVKNGSNFIAKKKSNSTFLSNSQKQIQETLIQSLVEEIDNSRFSTVSLKELNISKEVIHDFKKLIDTEELRIKKTGIDRFDDENLYTFPGEKSDFNFYKMVADSLDFINEDIINKVFWQEYGNWSTTTEWKRIIFVFNNGKKLIVENSVDKPNYLFTPWQIDFEGLKFKSNSIKFGQQIDLITNGQFFNKTTRDKKYAIFNIADYMYRQKLEKK